MRLIHGFVWLIILNFPVRGFAQSFSALQNSNYAGVNGIYTNPASATLMTHKRSAGIGVLGFDISNNYLTLNAPFSLWQLLNGSVGDEYRDANGKVDWQGDWIETENSKTTMDMRMSSELRGPSYLNQYGRFVWGTATRTRSQVNINQMSVGLWQWGKQWVDSQQLMNPLDIASFSFQANANSYQEISTVLGYRLINNSSVKLGLATSLKGILGLGSVNMSHTGVQFSATGMDTLLMSNGYMELAYTDNNLLNQLFRGVVSGSLPGLRNISGFGYGIDLGISAEFGSGMKTDFNAREGFKDYKLKIGVAILDIGSIGYQNQNEGFVIDARETPFKLAMNSPGFIQAANEGSQAVLDYTIESARQQGVLKSNNERTRVELPSSIQLQADWKIMKGVFVAAHWQQFLRLGDKWQFSQLSSLAIVPRFEHKWFEFAVPFRAQNAFDRISMGAHLRTGPVFMGTDNIANVFRVAPYSGMSFYMGITTLIK